MGTEKARGDGEAKNSWKNNQLNYAQLGRQIKKYRIQKKLRQKDLASLVYTTTNTISRLEIGSVGCSLEMLLTMFWRSARMSYFLEILTLCSAVFILSFGK